MRTEVRRLEIEGGLVGREVRRLEIEDGLVEWKVRCLEIEGGLVEWKVRCLEFEGVVLFGIFGLLVFELGTQPPSGFMGIGVTIFLHFQHLHKVDISILFVFCNFKIRYPANCF